MAARHRRRTTGPRQRPRGDPRGGRRGGPGHPGQLGAADHRRRGAGRRRGGAAGGHRAGPSHPRRRGPRRRHLRGPCRCRRRAGAGDGRGRRHGQLPDLRPRVLRRRHLRSRMEPAAGRREPLPVDQPRHLGVLPARLGVQADLRRCCPDLRVRRPRHLHRLPCRVRLRRRRQRLPQLEHRRRGVAEPRGVPHAVLRHRLLRAGPPHVHRGGPVPRGAGLQRAGVRGDRLRCGARDPLRVPLGDVPRLGPGPADRHRPSRRTRRRRPGPRVAVRLLGQRPRQLLLPGRDGRAGQLRPRAVHRAVQRGLPVAWW